MGVPAELEISDVISSAPGRLVAASPSAFAPHHLVAIDRALQTHTIPGLALKGDLSPRLAVVDSDGAAPLLLEVLFPVLIVLAVTFLHQLAKPNSHEELFGAVRSGVRAALNRQMNRRCRLAGSLWHLNRCSTAISPDGCVALVTGCQSQEDGGQYEPHAMTHRGSPGSRGLAQRKVQNTLGRLVRPRGTGDCAGFAEEVILGPPTISELLSHAMY